MSSPSSTPSPVSQAPPAPPRTLSPLRTASTASSSSADTIVFRELRRDDYNRGFPAILSQLTALGDVSQTHFEAQFDLQARSGLIVCIVGVDTAVDKIVCTASLLLEPKFIHACGLVGHVEDVVVDEGYRGRNLGARIIAELVTRSRTAGCYKTILDCAEKNVAFYEGCGFKRVSAHMAYYHTENDASCPLPAHAAAAPATAAPAATAADPAPVRMSLPTARL